MAAGLGDRGAGTVLALAVIGAIVATLGLLLPLGVSLVARQRVAGAADAAALAAADVTIGLVPGVPCSVASVVAAANGATVRACRIDGSVVTVQLVITVLGVEITGTATAGPESERPTGLARAPDPPSPSPSPTGRARAPD